ncbi:MAG TPA: hypothetical protein PLG21_18890 [Anaerolineae bacterium]|nr:hypothetical protein [Anaerolineae bacterium]
MEVYNGVDPNDAFNWGITIVKLRDRALIDQFAPTLQSHPYAKVVTRPQPDCDWNMGNITAEANRWYDKLNALGVASKWWGHIPINEPNNVDCGTTADAFQTFMRDLTSGIDWWYGQTHIRVPWTTPPFAVIEPSENAYVTALINSGALSARYSDGSGPIWRYIGAHNYWNCCADMLTRYGVFVDRYVQRMARPYGKQILVDEVNSNAACAVDFPIPYGGYGDPNRLTDLLRFMGQIDANLGAEVLMNIVFVHTNDTVGCRGSGWRQFDYTPSQWNTIASGAAYPFSCP